MKSVKRLFSEFVPSNYQLDLELDPARKKFSGSVKIKGRKTGRPSQRLTFHQKDLKVTKASITRHDKRGDEEMPVDRVNNQKSYDELRLHSSKMLYPGEYTITIEFNGLITDPMNGLYPCYFKHDGQDKMLLATQFESHHAREVFPCVDEPEAKATFDLTITSPDDGTVVIANTSIKAQKSIKSKSPKVQTAFETTPLMSTYLLAFVQGDVGFKEATTKSGTQIRAFATPDNVKFTDFALNTAVKCLEFYEEYFAIPFPLAKSDMIALPDFASGAMENWGLVTYREQCMLVDPKNTSLPTKQYVAMVVAHELAHQWFGNLVTMKWWTDLWLNEGFASWIEYLAIDHLFPDWQMWTQFVVDEQQSALKLDALDNTHAIEVPISHPDEIRSIFDAISYNKGASVIHMLHGYLGEEDFRDGLRLYLKKHAYKNTSTSDLWAALEEVSGKPVKQFMHAWTSMPGFPLLSVHKTGKQVEFHQERFYMQKPAKTASSRWPIPILGSHEDLERLDKAKAAYQTDVNDGFSLKVNKGQSGFYRTLYASDILADIATRTTKMDPTDRLGVLADSFETSKAGYGSAVDSLKLLEHFAEEDNSAVWDIIAGNIGEIRRVMDDDDLRGAIKPHIIKLTAKQLNRLGTTESKTDNYFDKLLRPTIIGLTASADEPKMLKWCQEKFDDAKSVADIHADLRSVVFNTAARHGDKKTFDKLLKFHDASDLSEERNTIASALTGFEQPELIDKALGLITTKTVRRQDAMYWLLYSFMNRFAKRAAWQWMKVNWTWLDRELGSDLSFSRTPIYAGRSFSDEDFTKEYDKFFADKASPGLERSIKQGREILGWQIDWKQRDLDPILQYLK